VIKKYTSFHRFDNDLGALVRIISFKQNLKDERHMKEIYCSQVLELRAAHFADAEKIQVIPTPTPTPQKKIRRKLSLRLIHREHCC
jgi:hypothetical protein